MLFRRREKSGLWSRLRLWLWPRVSWRRSALYYLKRTLRLSGTPYAIAAGAGVGAAVSCTPLVGLHIVVTLALVWLLGGNMLAGAIGTGFGNPVTFPFIWAATYQLGQFILGEAAAPPLGSMEPDVIDQSWLQLRPIFKPMMIGSIPIGIAVGCITFAIVYKAVSAYQRARLARLAAQQREHSANEAATAANNSPGS